MALRRVPDEVRKRHFPGQYEGYGPRKQAENEQWGADEFDNAGETYQRKHPQVVEIGHMRYAEELSRCMLQKKKPEDNP